MPTPTNWGTVEQDLIATILAGITATDARTVKSMLSEKSADEFPKGLNSIFTVSKGTRASDSDRSGFGYLRQDELWTVNILIYSASGKVQDVDRLAIQTLAAKIKGIINGYTPSGQVDNNGCLRLRVDAPAEDYSTEASSGLKIRQTYVLPSVLQSAVTGALAA